MLRYNISRRVLGESMLVEKRALGAERRRPDLRLLAGLALSVGLHGALVVAFIRQPHVELAGEAGEGQAISVEILQIPAVGSTAIAGAVDKAEGDESAPEEKPEIKTPEEKPAEAPKDKLAAEEGNTPMPLPRKEPPKDKTEPEDPDAKKTADAEGKENRQTVNAVEAVQGSSGTSAGDMEKYAREIGLTLAKTHPRARGRKGNVSLTFVVGQTGEITSLKVTVSSGDATLDAAVSEAVLGSKFPPPPAGMTEMQRTYVIPFRFR
jgi:TonB family protein